jgi:hypothetical protein
MPNRPALAFAFALAACAPRPEPPRPSPPVPSPPVPSATAPATAASIVAPTSAAPPVNAAPRDPCAPILAAERGALAGLGDRGSMVRPALQSFARCLRTPDGGAWLVVVEDVAPPPADDPSDFEQAKGHWAVVRVDAGGHAARVRHEVTWDPYANQRVDHASLVDFDGDGAPELVLATHVYAHEGADGYDGAVLTFRGGAIVPYAPADGLRPEEARDVDGDGRVDLLSRRPYVDEGDDSPSGFTYDMRGPLLLAHALPGGAFARDDAAAKAFARKACPAKNPKVFDPSPEADARNDVVCARIWGLSAAAVTRVIETHCAGVKESESARMRHARCGDVRVLEKWAALTPPVALP